LTLSQARDSNTQISFILVSKQGAELQASDWNWRPTLELARNAGLLADDTFELRSAEGYRWHVDGPLADQIAELIQAKLVDMRPGQRMLSDLTITKSPKDGEFLPDSRDSASYGWLLKFRDFCRRSGGFEARGGVDVRSESDLLQRLP
jgi:hypothetical protein